METYNLQAPAKINLYLEIVGDRPDGYHEVAMILQSIDLADRIEVKPLRVPSIRVHTPNINLGEESQNLAYKAAQLMSQEYPRHFAKYGGVEITIDKHIPVAAGLAGGSTDAAAVLVGMTLIWELGLTEPEIETLGAKLGSDIPFCVRGGTAIATGRGEQLDFLGTPNNFWLVLAKYQSLEISTAWAYQTYRQQFYQTYLQVQDQAHRTAHIRSGALVQAIREQNIIKIAQNLHNDLEKVVLPQYPQVAKLRETLLKAGALGAMMSGSGPSVFGLCQSQTQAEEIKKRVEKEITEPDLGLWVTQFAGNGVILRLLE